MAGKSDYFENAVLNTLRNVSLAVANVYVALHKASQWQASTAYALGDYVIPTAFDTSGPKQLYRCTTAGTSAATEPIWPTTDGGTVNDATAVWTEATPGIEAGSNVPPEVSGGSYARQAVTFNAPASGSMSNSADVTFPQATAAWGRVVLFALMDALTLGNRLYFNALTTSKQIDAGDQFKFPAGQLTVTED